MEKKNIIHVLIVGDDEQVNAKLLSALNKNEMKEIVGSGVKFNLKSFNDYHLAQRHLNNADDKSIPTFVFLDYFGGNGVSGPHLVEILKQQYSQAEVIFISGNEDEIGEVREQIDNNKVYDYVIKDDYTPTLCRLLLEKYVEKYS